jgi:hypothetical protein
MNVVPTRVAPVGSQCRSGAVRIVTVTTATVPPR